LPLGLVITIRIYRIIEDNEGIEPYVKSNEDLETEKESATFCSFFGKGDGEVGSMITGEEGVFICNECVELAVDIINAEKRKQLKSLDSSCRRTPASRFSSRIKGEKPSFRLPPE